MTNAVNDDLRARIIALEAQGRTLRIAIGLVLSIALALAWMPRPQAQASADPLRVRGLIVEDATGRPRIVLGPVDTPASVRGVGLRINDTNGVERFGLTLNERGSVGMGFDAPPGTGDERNRERINIVANETGGAYIRMKDRKTWIVSSWSLDEDNRAWMEFSDFSKQPTLQRRIGLEGDKTVKGSR